VAAERARTDRSSGDSSTETERERHARKLREVIEDIRRTSPGFSASDRLPREALYDRDRARAEAKAAAEKEGPPPAEPSGET